MGRPLGAGGLDVAAAALPLLVAVAVAAVPLLLVAYAADHYHLQLVAAVPA